MKFENLNKKWLIGGICAVSLLLGGGLVYANVSMQQEKESAQAEISLRQSTIKDVEKSVIGLYSNDKKEDFSKDLTNQKIDNVKIEVKKVDDKKVKDKLNTELNQIQYMLETKNSIQSFIPNDILKDDVTSNDINELSKKYDKSLTYNKKITEKNKLYLDGISKQFNDIKTAIEKTNALFLDDKKEQLADTVNEDLLNESQILITLIKNEKAKNEVVATHEIAMRLFTEKQEAEKVAEETAQIEKQETEKSSATEKTVAENSGGTNVEGNTGSPSNPSSNGGSPSAPAQQGGIEGIIASSPSAQYSDQIIGVVASGSSAQIYLFEKSGGQWQTILSTGGQVGSGGVGQASEYVSNTPKGSYGMSLAFGTGGNPGSPLPYRQITPNSYWISNVNDPQYNTWQERATSDPADEHLISYSQQYQYAIALDYNGGVGGGSAFFLHVSNGAPTAGCIAVPLGVMQQLITRIHGGARIINVNSQAELANY
ncbi:S-layer domain-containing protein [Carnobacterium maltaromaticum]|uniref:S-layer domain-containing protein n=1 Tax=Carnobacterium maltaromaticum TaxID=2751 RepID=UPI00026C84A3|nr:S-layer domain-containing protein [Carnobacterium maltaromaticum]